MRVWQSNPGSIWIISLFAVSLLATSCLSLNNVRDDTDSKGLTRVQERSGRWGEYAAEDLTNEETITASLGTAEQLGLLAIIITLGVFVGAVRIFLSERRTAAKYNPQVGREAEKRILRQMSRLKWADAGVFASGLALMFHIFIWPNVWVLRFSVFAFFLLIGYLGCLTVCFWIDHGEKLNAAGGSSALKEWIAKIWCGAGSGGAREEAAATCIEAVTERTESDTSRA